MNTLAVRLVYFGDDETPRFLSGSWFDRYMTWVISALTVAAIVSVIGWTKLVERRQERDALAERRHQQVLDAMRSGARADEQTPTAPSTRSRYDQARLDAAKARFDDEHT